MRERLPAEERRRQIVEAARVGKAGNPMRQRGVHQERRDKAMKLDPRMRLLGAVVAVENGGGDGPMIRRRIVLWLSVTLLILLSHTMALAQITVEVQMTKGLTFVPSLVIINVGDTVRWINVSDRVPHTATADRRSDRLAGFNSGSFPTRWLRPGESFEFTFTMAGTFAYHCIPHRIFGMLGTVIVNEAATPTTQFFIASAEAGRVILRWRVGGKSDRVGFHVLRSTGWEEEFVQVNDVLIPVQGDPSGETEYTFTDESIVPGTTYYYVLEDVNGQGAASFRGPAVAVAR